MTPNWTDPKSPISKHFTVQEALWLPSWQIYHVPSEDEKANILALAAKMDIIREEIAQPIHVHCWIRPTNVNAPTTKWHGKNYNAFVGGAPGSAHIEGKAVDWHASSYVCDDLREMLLPDLERLGLRMENKPGASWVHNDTRQPLERQSRYFRP